MVQNSPLVSIIMVTYNAEQFVKDAISSVLNNTYENIEVIISDDSSDDKTWEIINSFSDERMRCFRQKTNIGEYKNRNFCIHQSKGKYLVFIDGDDELIKEGLAHAVHEMEMQKEPPAIGIARSMADSKAEYLLQPRDVYKLHYFEKTVLNMSFARDIYNTRLLKRTGGLSETHISGDTAVRLKLSAKYPVLLLKNYLGKWRKHRGQASESLSNSLQGSLEPYRINRYFLRSDDCPLSRSDQRKGLLRIFKKQIFHGIVLLRRGKILNGIKLIINAI